MRIEMNETKPGADDGHTVKQYVEGNVYEVGEDLGSTFVKYKHAKETTKPVTEEKKADVELENKDAGSAPENKAAKAKKKS